MRAAVADVRRRTPQRYHRHGGLACDDEIAAHYVAHHAGVPATSASRPEDVVVYESAGGGAPEPVVIGLYGEEDRVRAWLPGYPATMHPGSAAAMLAAVRAPRSARRRAEHRVVDLQALPILRITDRDAGSYVSMGLVQARTDAGSALSAHRMLVLGPDRLTLSMVPGRGLAALHEDALRRGMSLPVAVNIGAPPAAFVASTVNGRFLPPRVSKLDLAGALAGVPLGLARARTQPTDVLATSEIVLEGELGAETADECLDGWVAGSMPEFLGNHGAGRSSLPVLTVTGISVRPGANYQTVVGPGREQSVLLGLGGAISVALAGGADPRTWDRVRDLHFGPAGGGMVLLAVALSKTAANHDAVPSTLGASIVAQHPFIKLVVFVDDDVDPRCAEDLLWAVATRTNLGVDCMTLGGHAAVPMVPSDTPVWQAERGDSGRCVIDATVPFRAQSVGARAFGPGPGR